jgi:hypothetical protein
LLKLHKVPIPSGEKEDFKRQLSATGLSDGTSRNAFGGGSLEIEE